MHIYLSVTRAENPAWIINSIPLENNFINLLEVAFSSFMISPSLWCSLQYSVNALLYILCSKSWLVWYIWGKVKSMVSHFTFLYFNNLVFDLECNFFKFWDFYRGLYDSRSFRCFRREKNRLKHTQKSKGPIL